MEISSSSATSCFDLALDFLDSLYERENFYDARSLKTDVRLLQTIDLYLSKCRTRNQETYMDPGDEEQKTAISFRIQDLINTKVRDLESAGTEISSQLSTFRKAIRSLYKTEIKESCINLLLDYYWLGDPVLVIDFVESVSENLAHLLNPEIIKGKLVFLKTFIRFAMFCRVDGQQLMDLLLDAEVVAINALRLICTGWFDKYPVSNKTVFELSRLIGEKINPKDPQVREIYIRVLTASKISRSWDTSVLEKNQHLIADFMDCLVHNICELLESSSSVLVSIMNQMLKLLDGLRFLTILLKHVEKFIKLHQEVMNLFGVVVCDAAIVIFSLFMNQSAELDLVEETDLALFRFLVELEIIQAEVAQVHPLTLEGFGFPRTNELGSVDFFLKNLKELAKHDGINGSTDFPVNKIQIFQQDLEFVTSFMERLREQHNLNDKLQSFWNRLMEVAYKAELVIDLKLVGKGQEYCLDGITRDISLMKKEAEEIHDISNYDGETKRPTITFSHMPSQASDTEYNEELVGRDNDVETIRRLTCGTKQLDIIDIVGMAGLGKTKLANEIYKAPGVISRFHVRAWCVVSQVCNPHDLLVQALCSIDSKSPDQYSNMDEPDLAGALKKALLRKKYLLVLDDLWDVEAWNSLEKSLPKDANGSRILITSRTQNLSLQFKHDRVPYRLCQLTDEESLKLLEKKVFGKKVCPTNLSGICSKIAKSCNGLPLSIVLVAGILATIDQNCWEDFAKCLSSSTILDDEYCMGTLELSYNHLPDSLKPCLLYFAAFQEDENVSVRLLLWLWISEGLVWKTTEEKSLEELADDYLKTLVDRSLVMISQQRTISGAKTCRLHDLVHKFCVKKATEENFLHNIHSWDDPCVLTGPSNANRVCDQNSRKLKIRQLMQFFPNLRSLLLSEGDYLGFWLPKLLRVLDLGKLKFKKSFPMEVLLLVHLRYLALYLEQEISIPYAIANLSRLQALLVRGLSNYVLPETIWNIQTLRYLRTTNSSSGFIFSAENLEVSPCLEHLHSLSLAIDPSSKLLQKILAKLPSIRWLRCVNATREVSRDILVFDCLSQLVSLRLHDFRRNGFRFPLNLKKLTLKGTYQPWSEISAIEELRNLEVLKLLYDSFDGEEWEMKEGEFPNLRFLKLGGLRLRSWTASSDIFPRLQKLVITYCMELKELPSCLEGCPNLEMIEVIRGRESLTNSAYQIQQEQKDAGNEDLRIETKHRLWSFEEEDEDDADEEEEEVAAGGAEDAEA